MSVGDGWCSPLPISSILGRPWSLAVRLRQMLLQPVSDSQVMLVIRCLMLHSEQTLARYSTNDKDAALRPFSEICKRGKARSLITQDAAARDKAWLEAALREWDGYEDFADTKHGMKKTYAEVASQWAFAVSFLNEYTHRKFPHSVCLSLCSRVGVAADEEHSGEERTGSSHLECRFETGYLVPRCEGGASPLPAVPRTSRSRRSYSRYIAYRPSRVLDSAEARRRLVDRFYILFVLVFPFCQPDFPNLHSLEE